MLGAGAGGLEEWDFSSRCEVCESCLGICLENWLRYKYFYLFCSFPLNHRHIFDHPLGGGVSILARGFHMSFLLPW